MLELRNTKNEVEITLTMSHKRNDPNAQACLLPHAKRHQSSSDMTERKTICWVWESFQLFWLRQSTSDGSQLTLQASACFKITFKAFISLTTKK